MKENILYLLIGFLMATVVFMLIGWTSNSSEPREINVNLRLSGGQTTYPIRQDKPIDIHVTKL